MPVPVVCPTCTEITQEPDDAIGRTLRCQKCREAVPVPSELPPAVPVEVSPAPRYGLWLFALVATVMFGILGVFSLAAATVFFLMIQPDSPVPGALPEENHAVATQSAQNEQPAPAVVRRNGKVARLCRHADMAAGTSDGCEHTRLCVAGKHGDAVVASIGPIDKAAIGRHGNL